MKFLESKKITIILIALIIIFAIIFIVVGERPRHKAEPKTQTQSISANTSSQDSPKIAEKSKSTPAANQASASAAPTPQPASQTDATPAVKPDTPENPNAQKTVQDIEQHQEQNAKELINSSATDNTDTILSESGLQINDQNLPVSQKTDEQVQKGEDPGASNFKSFTKLSEPEDPEKQKVSPGVTKLRNIENKDPLRFNAVTVPGTSIIFAVDTKTANTGVLLEGNDYWINLGKPEGATAGELSTYTLTGVTPTSAIIMNTITADSWRVTISKHNIQWEKIKPFANSK